MAVAVAVAAVLLLLRRRRRQRRPSAAVRRWVFVRQADALTLGPPSLPSAPVALLRLPLCLINTMCLTSMPHRVCVLLLRTLAAPTVTAAKVSQCNGVRSLFVRMCGTRG